MPHGQYYGANSAYSLVISTAIFPIYFPAAAITLGSVTPGMISILGFELSNTVVFSYTISAAFLALTILMPFLSGIADYTGAKKSFMRFFCYLGSFSCIALFFFSKGHYYIGTLGFLFSIIGWGGSMVFYNSFLPEIATPDRFDRLSAKGFTLGYIGSVLLLIQNLTMLLKPEWYGGIGGEMAARVSFLTVGLWWLLFAQIPEVVIDDYKSVKDWFKEASHETYWTALVRCLLDKQAPLPTRPTEWPPPRRRSPRGHPSSSTPQHDTDSANTSDDDRQNDSTGDSPPIPSPPRRRPPPPPPSSRRSQPRTDYDPEMVGRSLEHSFKALGLGLGATETEVKVAYRALARIYHPDKHDPMRTGMTQAEASEYFKIINNAQAYLCEVL